MCIRDSLCTGATGTDTGGSIRQPASFTGTVGLKPTYGRCSRWGIIAFASSFDQAGPITKNVTDSAIMLKAMSGFDPLDSTSAKIDVPDYEQELGKDIKGLRVGLAKEYSLQKGDSEANRKLEQAIQILKNKIKVSKELKYYFTQKYYLPDIRIRLTKKLLNFANSSIDLSDGLIDDLSKMINNQNLSFFLNENKIPISKNLLKIIKMKNMKKIKLVSNGDDYQILFTASKDKSRIIAQTSKNLGIKISKIGKICSNKKRSVIIDEKGKEIVVKNKGYVHQF